MRSKKFLLISILSFFFFVSCKESGSSGIGNVNLIEPADNEGFWEVSVTDTGITFKWKAVQDAKGYQFQIDDNADFSSPVKDFYTDKTSYTWKPDDANGYFYWRVRAYETDEEGNEKFGDWSTRSFVVYPYLYAEWKEANSSMQDIDIRNDSIFVADGVNGFKIFGLSDPSNPNLIKSYNIGSPVYKIDIERNYAYLGCGNDGVKIFDLKQEKVVSTIQRNGYVEEVFCKDTVLLYSDNVFDKVFLYNVANANNPESLSVIDYFANVIENIKNYPYVIIGDAGYIYDLSSPNTPTLLSDLSGWNYVSFHNKGSYIYAGWHGWADRVEIHNISNPSLPVYVEDFYPPSHGTIYGVFSLPTTYYLVTSTSQADLDVYDVEDPSSPLWKGTLNIGSEGYKLVCYDKYAYVAAGGGGLKIVRVME